MHKWTKQEEEDLKLGYELGLSIKEIGEVMHRSIASIKGKVRSLNILHPTSIENRKLNTYSYQQRLKDIGSEVICIASYINSRTNIKHKCLVCGKEHYARPDVKLQGYGHCGTKHNSGRLLPTNSGIVYLVYIKEYNLYKIGITQKTTKERMQDNRINSYEIILERHFDSGIECEKLEKVWLSNTQEYKINTGLLRTGNTETFRF